MDQRYNYFQQNPNSLVNGQSSFGRSSADGTRSTNNYSGSISSTSSQDQSPFHETKHTIPNAVPLMNNHSYQMDPTNQLPCSSGPPMTNAKRMYENTQSSIPNAMNLAQSNAENYPIDPDFQLQPHLTGLLPQQSKKVPELYPVDKYNSSSRGSIAANMNTNYFSSNKPYPEPKIIEYDMEETSNESSPQHTSSLYSESTDQDSESIHPISNFSRHPLKINDCHVTKESKTTIFSNQELPVPSQFADLSLARDDGVDDQQSILHSAYNQDDDVIEDIPLSENINQNKIEHRESPKSQFSDQNTHTPIAHMFDSYASKMDDGQNKQNTSSIFNNAANYSPYSNSSNIQNAHNFNRDSYFNQSNTSTQPSSSNNSVTQSQSKPLFPYGNTELFSHQQEPSNIQNYNEGWHLGSYNQQNKHIQPVFQNSNASQIDSNVQSNAVSGFIQDKRAPSDQSTSPAQAFNDQNSCQPTNSSNANILPNQQNVQTYASINQQFTTNSSLTTTQSVSPITTASIENSTLRNPSSLSESMILNNQNMSCHTNDGQTSSSFNLSVANNSQIDSLNQDPKNIVHSEFDIQHSKSNRLVDSQQERTVDQSEPLKVEPIESQADSVKSLSPPPIRNFSQPNNFFNPKNSTAQKSIPTTGLNVSHYFNSTNANNQSIFNQQSLNLQSHSQQINVLTQDIKPIVSSLPPSDKSNNFMTFSNPQNTSMNVLSSNQQQKTSFKKELELTENKFDSNMLSNETVAPNSAVSHSVLAQSDSLNMEPLENNNIMIFHSKAPENVVPNDQFSNMTIDNQQNIGSRQEQVTPASYFSKESSFDEKNSSNAFQTISSTIHNIDPVPSMLSEANYLPESVSREETNIPSSSADSSSAQQIDKPAANQFIPPQQFSNKRTSDVLPETNQLPSPMFNSEPKSDGFPPSTPNLYSTQFNNQSTSVSSPISSESNQLPSQVFSSQIKSDTLPPYQSVSSPYQTSSTFSSTFNQSPLQIFSNQPQSTVNPPSSSEFNQLPPNTVNNEQKTIVPPIPTEVNQGLSNLNNQPISSTLQPVVSAIKPIPPQMFNSPAKSEMMSPIQPAASGYPVQSFSNKMTQNTVPPISSVSNQIPPQAFGNQPKSGFMSPLQPAASRSVGNQPIPNTVPPATSQIPPQTFNYQSKSDTILPQTTFSQHTSLPFNNQLRSNIVPPGPTEVNQFPPQIFSNQIKSDAVQFLQSTTNQFPSQSTNNQLLSNTVSPKTVDQPPSQMFSNQPKSDVSTLRPAPSQYQPQPLNNTPRPNMIPPVSSTANLFPSSMPTNQPGLNAGQSNKLVTSRYPSQTLGNQPLSTIPPIQPATNQYPSQQFSNQSKPNTFPPPLSATNPYPSLPFNNQPGQQVLSKPNLQPPSSNQLYSQTNLAQPAHNQWPPYANVNQTSQHSNQTNPIFNQPPIMNSSNLSTVPPNVNQSTQMHSSQMLPPNPLTSNNYYNQVQDSGNLHQPRPPILPGQNAQLASKGYPQQNNMGLNQANYQQQQPNAIQPQPVFHQQHSYKTEQNSSTVQQGFAKTWGYDNLDLLKSRDVLPGDGVLPPEIKLPQGYANCDNCSPDIFRCTMNKFPSSKNLLEKSRLPLGILIHPYKDLSRLTVIQCETITRCRNCRSYINPFVQFIDNSHWKCNLCYRVNELPGEFQIDPYTKTLGDPSRRPEIQNATIEYIASQDYMVRPPQPALYLFLLDVSRLATLTGYLEIVCDRILNKVMTDEIPGDSRTNIGFITFDSSVHFYQIAGGDGGQPKQLIVSDISEIFLPLPDGLMVNLEENKAAIKDLLTNLPNHFRESYDTGCALGAALQAAFKLLAPRGGRVTVFQSSLPNCGPGSLQPRDAGTPLTGDRVQNMAPSTDFYKKLSLECSAEQIAVDMFFISSQYLDIATISGISKYSAGCIHNFSQFDVKSPTMVTRFINCFDRYLTRKIGFEALLRLRCTRGVSIHSFHGNFFVRSYDLLMLPNVNPDNAYGMQLAIEDNLEGVSVVCFQAALLYTSSNAERRIRVHTLCIPVTDNLNDIFHNADQQAISCLIAKMAVDRSTEKSLSDAREAFFNAISDSLSAFKLGCSSYSGPGTMLAPLSLKVFPLYILATLKHIAFRTNSPTRLDDRMFSMCQMKSLPLNILIQYLYPNLYPIHSLEEQPKINYEKLTEIPLPPVLQLSAERIESNGIYLMDDSETLTIFIGHRCSDQLIKQLFGYVNVSSMPELITTLPEVESKPSYLLRSFISYVQYFKPYALPIEIIKDNGPLKLRFYSRLIEDKFESSLSYYEFLQRLSQQVR